MFENCVLVAYAVRHLEVAHIFIFLLFSSRSRAKRYIKVTKLLFLVNWAKKAQSSTEIGAKILAIVPRLVFYLKAAFL